MRSALALLLLTAACGARTAPIELDAGSSPVNDAPPEGLALPPIDDCGSRVSTCPAWDHWPRKRLAEISEACFAKVGHTCGTFDISFEAPGCAVAFEEVSSSVSRAFLACVREVLVKERWICLQEGGRARFFETCR
ncbi:MAG: hypothetical protein HYV09_10200 [Deltaproteobacteria bacterium]|nr:hypothetical protein [Deltaproteobacteria bacterium]